MDRHKYDTIIAFHNQLYDISGRIYVDQLKHATDYLIIFMPHLFISYMKFNIPLN